MLLIYPAHQSQPIEDQRRIMPISQRSSCFQTKRIIVRPQCESIDFHRPSRLISIESELPEKCAVWYTPPVRIHAFTIATCSVPFRVGRLAHGRQSPATFHLPAATTVQETEDSWKLCRSAVESHIKIVYWCNFEIRWMGISCSQTYKMSILLVVHIRCWALEYNLRPTQFVRVWLWAEFWIITVSSSSSSRGRQKSYESRTFVPREQPKADIIELGVVRGEARPSYYSRGTNEFRESTNVSSITFNNNHNDHVAHSVEQHSQRNRTSRVGRESSIMSRTNCAAR